MKAVVFTTAASRQWIKLTASIRGRIMPKLQTTPEITTVRESNVVLGERKNKSRMTALSISEAIKKNFISFCILSATIVLINGRPLKCVSIVVEVSKAFTAATMSFTILDRLGELSESLLMRTAIR